MPGGDVSRSSQLDVLRAIGRNFLTRFLGAYAADLTAQHISLPGPDLGDTAFFQATAVVLASASELAPVVTQTLSKLALMTAAPPASRLAPPSWPQFSLRKGNGYWLMTYNGELAIIRHERGMFYVAYLLLHPPDHPIHAIDLMAKIPEMYRKQLGLTHITDPATGKSLQLTSSARLQERSLALDDLQAMRAIYKRERELEAILDSDDASEPVKAEALRELEPLIEFQRHHAMRSKDSAQNMADTVRTAMWRLQRHLQVSTEDDGTPHLALCPFATHIANYILFPSARLGTGCFIYEPPPEVAWKPLTINPTRLLRER